MYSFFYFSIIITMSFFLLSGDTFRIVTFPSFKVASTVVLPGAWSLKWTFHSLGQAGTEVFVFHSFVRASPEVLSCRYLPSCGRVSSHIPVPRRQENGGDHLIALPEKGFWLLLVSPRQAAQMLSCFHPVWERNLSASGS